MVIPGQDSTHRAAVVPGMNSWMTPTSSPTGTGDPYSAAVHQQASDYDEIMGNYRSLFGSSQTARPELKVNPLQAHTTSFTPQSYSSTGSFNDLKGKLTENSETGGYSQQEISDLRARGISPIRAIYAAALRNMQRQKSLSGGYSPNYGALQTKLARESSAAIGDQTIKANADIADRVSTGRTNALSQLSPLVSRENDLTNATNASNSQGMNHTNERNAEEMSSTDRINAQIATEIERLNANNSQNAFSNQMNANQGMQSLYGTTPALTSTFGNQVLQSNAQNLQGQIATSNAMSRINPNPNSRGAVIPRFGG